MNAKYRVFIIESERGFGQRVESFRDFGSFEEANTFSRNYNSENDTDYVPDWYMMATKPQLVDLDKK